MDERAPTALFEWWASARIPRDELPWRSTTDPWSVLVSETMLVQTQVDRVASRYPAIIARFPTPESLAGSSVGDLLSLWSGLGYYRRAINLHRTSTALVDLHGGQVPSVLADLLALPGVGAYTARAVLAFAFDLPVGPLDTNIRRVVTRAFGFPSADAQRLADDAATRSSIRAPSSGSSRSWNLALMDLGSGICVARGPRCTECPLGPICVWRRVGGVDPASVVRPKAAARYEGSDREIRGTIVRAVCEGPLRIDTLATLFRSPFDARRTSRVIKGLTNEGLVVERDGALHLP